jgi:hypothetical protein
MQKVGAGGKQFPYLLRDWLTKLNFWKCWQSLGLQEYNSFYYICPTDAQYILTISIS